MGYLQEVYEVSKKVFNDNKVKQLLNESTERMETASNFVEELNLTEKSSDYIGYEVLSKQLEISLNLEDGDEYGYSMYSEPSLLVEMKKLGIKHMGIKFNVKGSLNDKKGVFRNTNTTEELDTIKELKNGNILIK